ncbi:hypothetical protein EST38_g7312 [Candolleomyces aberdarensis]|uniref:NACHT domain-containing protein n=1 Tax=Candolleomyces aberdarensis TaxID=2316362 RepID=A0A4Q2DHA9_9AGAR|nr:hypothetical protein EST38_g7312 [Candolleomyces aberdarensis]
MWKRIKLRFDIHPKRPARGTTDDTDNQNHRGETHNHLIEAPQTVFFQQGSQAPIFNGPIAGGVSNYHTSNIDALQTLYNHSATGAMHDSDERFPPPLCHPGTREAVVIRIRDWCGYQQTPGKPIMWVHAPAGYGKTAIAGTVSKMFEEAVGHYFSALGATFFFWRTSPERNNPVRFIISIAHQLAMSIPEIKPHIANAVSRNPLNLKKSLEVQLVKLIVEPFKAIGRFGDIPNRLVIIDGLDECIKSEQESRMEKKYAEDQERVQVRVLDLIHTLQSHRLPLSFLILSRPEPWIKQHIESRSFTDLVEVVDLYAVGDHMNDVEKYIQVELSRIAANIGDVKWPTKSIVHSLVLKTNGHMVYASTVIRHIDDPYHDPRKRLRDIFGGSPDSNPDFAHSTPFSSLYELYRQIMRSCPRSNRSLMVEVLEDIVVTKDSFRELLGLQHALATLDSLSGRVVGSGTRAIRGLHAVLRLASNPNESGLYSNALNPFIHSSFVEFLTDPMLSLEFAVNKKKANRRLLWNGLECMSAITGQWKVEVDLALHLFQFLWVGAWSSKEDARLLQDEYVKVVKKLLTVDLTICFIEVFSSSRSVFSDPFVGFTPHMEPRFVDSLEHLSKESDPLAQQAIMHVLSSTDRAVGHHHHHHHTQSPVATRPTPLDCALRQANVGGPLIHQNCPHKELSNPSNYPLTTYKTPDILPAAQPEAAGANSDYDGDEKAAYAKPDETGAEDDEEAGVMKLDGCGSFAVGAAFKTQERVQEIAREDRGNLADRLTGDKDCGQKNTWYIFGTTAFYLVSPVSGEYVVGSPLFESIHLKLPTPPVSQLHEEEYLLHDQGT